MSTSVKSVLNESLSKIQDPKTGLYGIVYTSNDKVVLDCTYNEINSVASTCCLFMIKKGNQYGFTDKRGRVVIDCVHDGYKLLSPELIEIQKNNLLGVVDQEGDLIYDCCFQSIKPFAFNGDNFFVCKENNLLGCINNEGRLIIDCAYDEIEPLESNFLKVKKGKFYGCTNHKGKMIVQPIYLELQVVPGNSLIKVRNDKQAYGCYDFYGNEIIATNNKSLDDTICIQSYNEKFNIANTNAGNLAELE
ncbi:MAG: WG repeat-containing protein [Phycisphaerales bacterium]|nr:WG repeat-containing protein [Phycisphaerales bacterium]